MWTKNLLATSMTTALLFSASANATTQNDEVQDSVFGWGKWSASIQTAAGPGVTGAAVLPLLSGFAQPQNNINSDAFVANTEGRSTGRTAAVTEGETIIDNAGLRQYQAWYSANAHAQPNSTERAYFTEFEYDEESNALNYAVGTDAGEQTHNPRQAFYEDEQSAFVSTEKLSRDKTTIDKIKLGGGLKIITQEQTVLRSQQTITVSSPEEDSNVFYGSLSDFLQERSRTRSGLKLKNTWLGGTPPWGTWSKWEDSPANNSSNFIYGQSASIDAVTQVLSGAGTAVYSGGFMGFGGGVELTLDFGKKSWSGSFNPNNAPAFAIAKGTFKGVDLAGKVTATKNIASGTVDASFFGSKAQHIGGIADIKGTKGERFVEVFGTSNIK
ncbi:hypothetical protein ACMXYN_08365 [Neptuniibacter sp. PT8_73]|uniref:hypothetical protein n=1 Tax=Neptuniibacter sp. PT8_73 TaxID=3398206 RepID=UPI0039F5E71E